MDYFLQIVPVVILVVALCSLGMAVAVAYKSTDAKGFAGLLGTVKELSETVAQQSNDLGRLARTNSDLRARIDSLDQNDRMRERHLKDLEAYIEVLHGQLESIGAKPIERPAGIPTSYHRSSPDKRPQKIGDLISRHFTNEEVINLAFRLGVDPGEIQGETKATRPYYFVRLCQKRGLLNDLVELCRQSRPNVDWP